MDYFMMYYVLLVAILGFISGVFFTIGMYNRDSKWALAYWALSLLTIVVIAQLMFAMYSDITRGVL